MDTQLHTSYQGTVGLLVVSMLQSHFCIDVSQICCKDFSTLVLYVQAGFQHLGGRQQ